MNKRFLLLVGLLCLITSVPARAEPVPGDSCTGAEENNFLRSGGKEIPTGHFIVCKSGQWRSILSWDAAAAVTKIGNLTCTNGQILKFNGTTWGCAADEAGSGGDNLGDHIATTTLRSDAHNTDDLGTTAIRWKDGWFAGTVTGGTFAGSGASLTALNAASLGSGTIPSARMPALTGDVTTTAGSTATMLAANAVTSAKIADGTITAADTAIVGTLTEGKWCTVSSGKIVCTSDAPSGGGGAAFESFTTVGTATWTKPSTGAVAFVECWGGGGSGGRHTSGGQGGGGGGGYNSAWLPLALLSGNVTVTVGAGGAARTTRAIGEAGGTSSFGTYLSAYGGGGGGDSVSGGGGGGQLSVGDTATSDARPGKPIFTEQGFGSTSGSPGLAGYAHGGGGGYWGHAGGASVYGGGGGGGRQGSTVGAGGLSSFGGNGGAAGSPGVDGAQPGGGGGASNSTSGKGGDGQCNVTVF